MASRRFTYLFTLLSAVIFYIAYQEWFSWLALVALLGLPWLSLLVSLPGILTFRAEPGCPGAIPMGQSGQVRLEGTSLFPVPPFLGRLRITHLITGEQRLYKKDTNMDAGHCGGYRVTPEKVRVCDYLGLFRFRVRAVKQAVVLVRPEAVTMDAPPDLSRYLTRAWRPKPGGGFAENHELRLYRPGDSLNQVHWKLTAKTGKLIIREAMEPERGLVLLTMDLNGSAAELDGKFGRLQWLGNYLLEQNIKYEIRVLTADGIVNIPVAGEADLKKGIDRLLCCAPAQSGSVTDMDYPAAWKHHIGGDSGAK